jgi:hypothetical protein
VANFNFKGMLLAVETLVNNLPTIMATEAEVRVGQPESIGTCLGSFITLGSTVTSLDEGAMGMRVATPRVQVSFVYAVGGDERAAELAIADLILELIDAVEDNPTLGGVCDHPVTVDTSPADLLDYQARSGAEFRYYPLWLVGNQQHYD